MQVQLSKVDLEIYCSIPGSYIYNNNSRNTKATEKQNKRSTTMRKCKSVRTETIGLDNL